MDDGLRGTCDACGKVYRVPSAGRAYPCKACTGTVRASAATTTGGARTAATPDAPRAASRVRSADPTVAGRPTRTPARSPAHEPGGRRATSAAAGSEGRRRYVPRQRSLWTPVLGLIVVLVVAALIVKVYMAARFPERGKDLETVSADFVEAWAENDLDEIVAFHPTQGREQLRERLDAILAGRSWPRLPEPTAWAIEGGDRRSSIVALQTADAGEVSTTWQYDPIGQRWWLLGLELPMLPLGDAPELFRAAWARSDPDALQPFFRGDAAEKMGALVVREARERGWATWPALGPAALGLSSRAGALDARHPVVVGGDEGELLVRWAYHEPSDRWVVTGFAFP